MKKMLVVKLAILAMVVALGFVMVSCELGEGTGDDGVFAASNGDSVKVSNQTKTDLVAFKGSIEKKNLIGGVRAGATNHALKNGSNLGKDPAQFKMIFITGDQYNKGYNKDTAMFTQMYVFWNGNVGDNSKTYEISQYLGGQYEIQIWNTSNYDVEFRVGGIAGATLGYAPAGMTQTKLRAGAGDYIVYPIFQRHNTLRDTIDTVVPRYDNGNAIGWEVEFGTNKLPVSLNLQSALDKMKIQKLGAACVIIDNQAGSGVRFYQGLIPMVTPSGNYSIMQQQAFTIDMPTSPDGKSFQASRNISNFKVSNMGFEAPVKDQNGETTFTLLTDKVYTITVSGDGAQGSLAASINTASTDDFVMEETIALGKN